MSYDLFVFIQNKFNNKDSVYATGHILEPALEISIVFGRQLLNFLKIKKKNKEDVLDEFTGEDDDITINQYYPLMTDFPINDPLIIKNKVHIIRLLKVANKAAAHFTDKNTTTEEFSSMRLARYTIYVLLIKYLPDLNPSMLRWNDRKNYLDAIQK